MITTGRSTHASAVLVGERAVVIRGPSGSGKSRLALDLIEAARVGQHRFARLIGDDRVVIAATDTRLLVSPAPKIAGMIEVRGLGVLQLPYEPLAVVGLVVDLAAVDAARLPAPASLHTTLCGVSVPRLPVAAGVAPLPVVLAAVGHDVATFTEAGWNRLLL